MFQSTVKTKTLIFLFIGSLNIKFPIDMLGSVSTKNLGCIALYGFTNPSQINCTMSLVSQSITINGAFPSNLNSLAFSIMGI